ncbi:glucose/arabinose dehydrogenase/type 1 glutamine amidotransferase [Amycolatopsis lexingtonensis]|uniref:Glucose/arabinose dehydrogenase/type 1 glutamine amidotransferase n=2 Tax=Amycolatopsis lexingtonensis TaxID=218822 RepID=A0ABR9HWT7_9PSEU|nr:ThuA domain-containing protein [Amycolatopsis lexingtonensis]MBE1495372.1 glucose/arabinose dehydrogenase/type 1 glutamine amidotransferase [Amycolatopsis lexingtonensis]
MGKRWFGRRGALVLAIGSVLAAGAPLITMPVAQAAPAAVNVPVNVLVFHGTPADQKDPVLRAADAIARLGTDNGITVTASSDPAVFSTANLAKYRGVVYLSAQGVTLSREQEGALQAYMKAGGGFLGISDAARAQDSSQWFTGLIGARPIGARPTPEAVAAVTASGENPPNETKEKLADNNENTKWLTFATTGWAAYKMAAPVAVSSYSLVSANDFPGRNPKNWTLQGSADGTTWTDLDTRANEVFTDPFQTRTFTFANTTAYANYRLNITANAGEPIIQLADLKLFKDTSTTPPPPEPAPQQAVIDVLDAQHPATQGLPQNWTRTDRWLNWETNPVGTVHTVAQVEEKGYNPGVGANGAFHPISWCRDYDGGRSFYTGMGRTEGSYGEDQFRKHLLGALRWTTGMVRGDCQAGIAANYKVERLTGQNAAGQLDQIGEPHGLTIAPDGKVFYIGKAACPTGPVVSWDDPNVGLGCGTIHQWDPVTKKPKLLTTLRVMGNRGSGDELVKNEEGLLGLTLDPKFSENGWMYAYWMPHESIDRDKRIGKRTVSRFTYNLTAQTLDQATRKDLLSWDVQIHSCCHAGGGMAFDKDGNLYIGSGDNNSSGGSNGYSGNNWTLDYKGISFQDARRTAGNTNDLGGKILRIHPEANGTYTIPQGNLFPNGPADKTRPEIYVMGVRNISRLQIDPVHNWMTAGWVGPDASSPSPELGPAKYETATIITEAGNHGWPYCMGNRQPYRDRSSTNAAELTGWYDCDNPVNTSPRNTGLVNLPPIKDNMIWYSPDGGGPVFPKRPGSSIPTYVAADATYTEPYLRGGGQAIMSGPTYHRSLVNPNSGVAWPAYWDNKWFIGDEANAQNRVAVTVDPAGVPTHQPPVFAETFRQIIPGGAGDTRVQSWMDAKFGPDGALYVLDYGNGFFSLDANQKLLKISYTGGAPTPAPAASSTMVQNKALTAAFTGSKSGGVSYRWEFGDGSVSTQADPRHTYPRTGIFTAKLTVTYANGEAVTTRTSVNVGCLVADPSPVVTLGDSITKVVNRNAGGGCTVDDFIDDEGTWSTHAAFVNHVDQATQTLSDLGVLNDAEVAELNAAAAASPIGTAGTTGYEALFDGTAASLRAWEQAPSGQFSLQPDGSIRSAGGLGMLWYAQRQFGDFSVKVQFKDIAPDPNRANSGVFVRFPDPRTPLAQRPPGSCGTVGSARDSQAWVAIYCGHEIQIYDGDSGEPQKTGSVYNFDPRPLDQAGARPKGTWNEYEIKVVGQHYTMIRNGVVINEFDNTPGQQSSRAGDPPTDLRQFVSGFIGLQNHSDNDLIEFRNIRVRQL